MIDYTKEANKVADQMEATGLFEFKDKQKFINSYVKSSGDLTRHALRNYVKYTDEGKKLATSVSGVDNREEVKGALIVQSIPLYNKQNVSDLQSREKNTRALQNAVMDKIVRKEYEAQGKGNLVGTKEFDEEVANRRRGNAALQDVKLGGNMIDKHLARYYHPYTNGDYYLKPRIEYKVDDNGNYSVDYQEGDYDKGTMKYNVYYHGEWTGLVATIQYKKIKRVEKYASEASTKASINRKRKESRKQRG